MKKFEALGVEVLVDQHRSVRPAGYDFAAAGATVSADALKGADIIVEVKRPEASKLQDQRRALVVAVRGPYGNDAALSNDECRVAAFRWN